MIALKLTVEEINTILSALSKQPYGEVFQLIGKIQQQGQGQLKSTIEEKE